LECPTDVPTEDIDLKNSTERPYGPRESCEKTVVFSLDAKTNIEDETNAFKPLPSKIAVELPDRDTVVRRSLAEGEEGMTRTWACLEVVAWAARRPFEELSA